MYFSRLVRFPRTNLKLQYIFDVKHYSEGKPARYKPFIFETTDENVEKSIAKLIYNTILEHKRIRTLIDGRKYSELAENNAKKMIKKLEDSLPVSLKYILEDNSTNHDAVKTPSKETRHVEEEEPVNFPFSGDFKEVVGEVQDSKNEPVTYKIDLATQAGEEIRKRYELMKDMKNWMTSYDNFDDQVSGESSENVSEDEINYGTPDPKSKISNVPCGGCGALLHCKDTSIPGYIPSEIFKNQSMKGGSNLEAIVCQRCHFLKNYNIALQMRVSPDDYPKILQSISKKKAVVVLMVDLLDFPCSIWPGIADIFGGSVPIVVVGNKVDLLPKDSPKFLQRIASNLLDNIKLSGFGSLNIKHVALISAKTGFGLEALITKLNSLYNSGDFYIVGCTNVGKSSLFNALIQSDFCKTQAVDLIQRATTSVWPGTTLNLLKFPIKRGAGFRQHLRHKRLQEVQKIDQAEEKIRLKNLRETRDPKYASLIGRIDITNNPFSTEIDENRDNFTVRGFRDESGKLIKGIDENLPEFKYSKWCFDTPGVVQPDQITHLLTAEELLLTLPKQLIMPRSYSIKAGSSFFIAGLARLDYVEGKETVKLTVFSSNELPVTVCPLADANKIYEDLLHSTLFKVPVNSPERLAQWPKLELAKSFSVTGKNWKISVQDVVLSSAGWISITALPEHECKFQAWTPEKRGVYLRDCLLPYAVALSGHKVKNSIAYKSFKFYLQD